ncbi:hypothetical protein CEB3_c42200 [Peptococcaceae bacterium CEB3]|nr:hypothetical protein CEB3_c42200 [Peptococcaceae bacterium CEB3]
MVAGTALLWLAVIVLWWLAGGWEWNLPQGWQEGLSRWRSKFGNMATLDVHVEIADTSELEVYYWQLRQSLRREEARRREPLRPRLIVRGGACGGSFCERRFRGVECLFAEPPR